MIFITGDMHGLMERFQDSAFRHIKKGDTLIICGDFGFLWEGTEEEKKALKKLEKKKYEILFVDGIHENFDLLESYPEEEYAGGRVHRIGTNLRHLMRGELFTIDGKKIFAFGGGESIEKEDRVKAGKWWEREMPTLEEMQHGVDRLDEVDRRVDYIVTHEPPTRVRTIIDNTLRNFNMLDAYLDELSTKVAYEKWFFGSLHLDRKITAKSYAVFNDLVPAEIPQGKRRR